MKTVNPLNWDRDYAGDIMVVTYCIANFDKFNDVKYYFVFEI